MASVETIENPLEMTQNYQSKIPKIKGNKLKNINMIKHGSVWKTTSKFRNKKLIAEVKLPIAGLLSDKKATEVAKENTIFKKYWLEAGCSLPYMGFNLLPLSVIPNFRITNKGLVDVNSMQIEPLFE